MKLLTFLCGLLLALSSIHAQGQSHARVDQSRYSNGASLFTIQSIEGEYGRFISQIPGQESEQSKTWRGYGIRNGLGIEVLKFAQFTAHHTLLSIRSKDSSLETMHGSRLAADASLVFSAPIGNLSFGYGLSASQLDLQLLDDRASVLSTGDYLVTGLNYFVNSLVSLQLSGKRFTSKYSMENDISIESMRSKTDNISLTLSIWL